MHRKGDSSNASDVIVSRCARMSDWACWVFKCAKSGVRTVPLLEAADGEVHWCTYRAGRLPSLEIILKATEKGNVNMQVRAMTRSQHEHSLKVRLVLSQTY